MMKPKASSCSRLVITVFRVSDTLATGMPAGSGKRLINSGDSRNSSSYTSCT
ncbi:hypothetical protein D3C81_2004140 [compost metagenome]